MTSTATDRLPARRAAARARWEQRAENPLRVTIGLGTCGIAAGAEETRDAVDRELALRGLAAEVGQVGCMGMCSFEPILELHAAGGTHMVYGGATAEAVPGIFAAYLEGASLEQGVAVGEARPVITAANGSNLQSVSLVDPETGDPIPFHRKQLRVVLANCGLIDPESVDDYLAVGGYEALETVLAMDPDQVIGTVVRSGLRGRGGGGFPTGRKWQLARATERWPKYVICNADEGDPGAFMDRSVLEGDPHAVIEGMTIAGFAIGAAAGYIYCRAEYPLAIARLETALRQMRELGLLGRDILGSGCSFEIEIKQGAGAFV
ncbi:MAG: NADH-quinone oxidoreductase subunit F, partial [Acidimicrobiia bacterium]|nr:NADH-quinone oxidoreductase subunit F [Acidimicrobiia bacterium]